MGPQKSDGNGPKGGISRRKLVTGLGLGGVAAAIGLGMRPLGNQYYQGPLSDHFDGTVFFNPGGRPPRGLGSFLKWQLMTRGEAWPASFPSPLVGELAERPRELPPGTQMRVTALGHASFLIETAGANLLVDPVLSERASPVSFAGPLRVNPPALSFETLPRINAVLVSHNHYDHMDITTLRRLADRDNPRFIVPLGNDTILKSEGGIEGALALDWDQRTTLPGGGAGAALEIDVVPTHHWSARGTRDRRHALWASFVISNGSATVYAVGDTGFGDGRTFRHVGSRHPIIDLALLPIGAYAPRWFMSEQHMDPHEAVRAFKLSGAKRALGHHWGTFKLTNEAIDEPPRVLAAARSALGIDDDQFVAAQPGLWTVA